MTINAILKNSFESHEIQLATNSNGKTIQIKSKDSGFGSSVNGGELLLLALATCYCNDIYREAAKRNMKIKGVEVEATCEFGADGEPGRNFRYSAKIDSDEGPEAIEDLLRHTDQVAEIQNTLRKGVEVVLQ